MFFKINVAGLPSLVLTPNDMTTQKLLNFSENFLQFVILAV